MTDEEAAWFGAWLSADGSITLVPGSGNVRPRIRVQFKLTDEDVLLQLSAVAAEFGGQRAVSGPHAPTGLGRKSTFHWALSGADAEALIERVWPWLSSRYQQRYTERRAQVPPQRRGRKLSLSDVQDVKCRLAEGGHGEARRLAREYGVSEGLISAIRHGRVWCDQEVI